MEKEKYQSIIPSRELFTKKKTFLIFNILDGILISIFGVALAAFLVKCIGFNKFTFISFIIVMGSLSLFFAIDPEGLRLVDRLIIRNKYKKKAKRYYYEKF